MILGGIHKILCHWINEREIPVRVVLRNTACNLSNSKKNRSLSESGQTDRQTDRQTGRQAGRQAGRWTDRQAAIPELQTA